MAKTTGEALPACQHASAHSETLFHPLAGRGRRAAAFPRRPLSPEKGRWLRAQDPRTFSDLLLVARNLWTPPEGFSSVVASFRPEKPPKERILCLGSLVALTLP